MNKRTGSLTVLIPLHNPASTAGRRVLAALYAAEARTATVSSLGSLAFPRGPAQALEAGRRVCVEVHVDWPLSDDNRALAVASVKAAIVEWLGGTPEWLFSNDDGPKQVTITVQWEKAQP